MRRNAYGSIDYTPPDISTIAHPFKTFDQTTSLKAMMPRKPSVPPAELTYENLLQKDRINNTEHKVSTRREKKIQYVEENKWMG
jgi:hypothetical protein